MHQKTSLWMYLKNKLLETNECISSVSVAINNKLDQKVNLTIFMQKSKKHLKPKHISVLPYTQIALFQIDNAGWIWHVGIGWRYQWPFPLFIFISIFDTLMRSYNRRVELCNQNCLLYTYIQSRVLINLNMNNHVAVAAILPLTNRFVDYKT